MEYFSIKTGKDCWHRAQVSSVRYSFRTGITRYILTWSGRLVKHGARCNRMRPLHPRTILTNDISYMNDSPTYFLRPDYTTRDFRESGLHEVDDEWFGPWIDIQETFSPFWPGWQCTTQAMRAGWQLEQQRRVSLCTLCRPGQFCDRHPDFVKL